MWAALIKTAGKTIKVSKTPLIDHMVYYIMLSKAIPKNFRQ